MSTNVPPTDQFNRVEVTGKKGYEAFAAVWNRGGVHVMIAAPSLSELAEAWMQIVLVPLKAEKAQHVAITKLVEAA